MLKTALSHLAPVANTPRLPNYPQLSPIINITFYRKCFLGGNQMTSIIDSHPIIDSNKVHEKKIIAIRWGWCIVEVITWLHYYKKSLATLSPPLRPSEKSTQPHPQKIHSLQPPPLTTRQKKIHPPPNIQTETAKTIKAVWSTALTIHWTDQDYFDIKLFVSTSLIEPTHHGQDESRNSTKSAKKTGPYNTPQDPLGSQEGIKSSSVMHKVSYSGLGP